MKKKCERCLYEWDCRVENPKVCPRCKRYLDIKPKKIKEVVDIKEVID